MIFVEMNAYYLLTYHIWMKLIDYWQNFMIRNGMTKEDIFRVYGLSGLIYNPVSLSESCVLSSSKDVANDAMYTFHKGCKMTDQGMLYPVISVVFNILPIPEEMRDDDGATHASATYSIVRDPDTQKLSIRRDQLIYGAADPESRETFDWHVRQIDSIFEKLQNEIQAGEETAWEHFADRFSDGGSPNDLGGKQ